MDNVFGILRRHHHFQQDLRRAHHAIARCVFTNSRSQTPAQNDQVLLRKEQDRVSWAYYKSRRHRTRPDESESCQGIPEAGNIEGLTVIFGTYLVLQTL